jgi:hypothetical protein
LNHLLDSFLLIDKMKKRLEHRKKVIKGHFSRVSLDKGK